MQKLAENLQTNLQDESFSVNLHNLFAKEIGRESYQKWLANLTIFSNSESELILLAPSKFLRDWVMREFIDNKKLIKIAQKLQPKLKKLSVIYLQTQNSEIKEEKPSAQISNLSKYDNIFAFGTQLNPRFTFDNFVSCKYNKLATSMAKIAAGIDAQINLFEDKIPLFIHGGVGMGKTHLAQAIAWKIKEFSSTKRVVYLSAEKFMYHFVQSLRNNDIMNFKEKMRTIDVLIVDDVQFIAGKDSTQKEFMNCFNSLVEDNKQVVLVCDRCPSNLENIDEQLKSRITGGMVVNFKNAGFEDRLAILKAKAQQHGEEICENILNFIAQNITSSIRDLEGAVKKLIASKVFEEKEITLENARILLSSYFKQSSNKAINIAKIQKEVSAFYNIKISDIISTSRLRSFARPRQIAIYLAKKLTIESLPKIGAEFGGKNHATIIHSIKLIEKLMSENSTINSEIKALEEKLSN
jgi:chromosomal replication initiator protein